MDRWMVFPDKAGKKRTYGESGCLNRLRKSLVPDEQQIRYGTRPLLILAIAAALSVWPAANAAWRWTIIPAAICIGLSCRFCFSRNIRWLVWAAPLLFAGSAIHVCLIFSSAERQAESLAGLTFELRGTALSSQSFDGGGCQAVILQDGGIRVYLTAKADIEAGSRVYLAVSGARPAGRKNPGGFDEAAWLSRQGIFLKTEQQADGAAHIEPAVFPYIFLTWGADARCSFKNLAASMLPEAQASLLCGLLIGDTSGLSPAVKYAFNKAGLGHLTSVSGANVAYLLLPATAVLRLLKISRSGRIWLQIVLLTGFGFITGWQVSISRAILMTGAVLAGKLLKRQTDPISTLSLAVLLILLLRPSNALSPGFWFSVTATAALIFGASPLADLLRRRLPSWTPSGFIEGLAAAVCAQIAVLPLSVLNGGDLAPAAFLANLPASPLAGGITLLATALLPLGRLFGWLLPHETWLLDWLARPLRFSLDILSILAGSMSQLHLGRIYSSQINPAFWIAVVIGAVSFWLRLHAFRKNPDCRSNMKGRFSIAGNVWIVLAGLACIWGLIWNVLAGNDRPAVQVWFLDVGQGDAILMRAQDGRTVFIDGGKAGSGYRVLLPAMDALAIDKVDLLIATHGHEDHVGGLIELIGNRRAKKLLLPLGLPEQMADEPAKNKTNRWEQDWTAMLLKSSREAEIGVQTIKAHDTIVLGKRIRFDILYPDPEAAGQLSEENGGGDGNEWSVQMLADLSGCRILLTADCTKTIEENLLRQNGWPPANILKVAHHGSKMTTETGMLKAVKPETAIISVGKNQYGHPAAKTLQRLTGEGCRIYRTDRSGAIVCRIESGRYEIESYLEYMR
ncbi:MAG: DNA internalization-related competence protein ComEC/Rec2 [Clostridiaceae bacterium]|nr:DNA internalization-related competence protein ComEC/Rec2 [Clostridiaceae bacterium]